MWTPNAKLLTSDEPGFDLSASEFADFERHALPGDCVLLTRDGSPRFEFAMFERAHGPPMGPDGETGPALFAMVFHGEGALEMREFRHSHWGENGYLFYPPLKAIAAAMELLAKRFD